MVQGGLLTAHLGGIHGDGEALGGESSLWQGARTRQSHTKHGKVTQNMHGASRNYRYVWDVSTSPSLIPARPRVGK